MKVMRAIAGAGLLCLLTGTVTPTGQATANVVAGSMPTGAITAQPVGHFRFCRENPEECGILSAYSQPLHLSPRVREIVETVNREVNAAISASTDERTYGRQEHWAYPVGGTGDCEDYVLQKRRELNRRGVPISNLLITVVTKPHGEGHAVLAVRTDEGDLVLDNLDDAVRSWTETPYRYQKRQSERHTGTWVAILEHRDIAVAAID